MLPLPNENVQPSDGARFPLLWGRKIRLRSIAESDLPRLREYFQDPVMEAAHMQDRSVCGTDAEIVKWLTRAEPGTYSMTWMVDTHDGETVGLRSLSNINHCHRSAGPFVGYIDPAWRRKGFLVDSDMVIVRFGFEYLNLHRIWNSVRSTSGTLPIMEAGKLYGLKHEGTLRAKYWFREQPVDEHIISALVTDRAWRDYWKEK